MEKEGWSIDITSSNVTHYYKDGVSLCKRKLLQFYMDKFDKSIDYSQILGKNCTNCYIKLNCYIKFNYYIKIYNYLFLQTNYFEFILCC
jgi:hypothetical protein